ncbi:P-loop nucleotide/nucleoside kinase family protein [Flindersiella endophytica]
MPEDSIPPKLIVVCGPMGGYGKTTLAHAIARAIGCPAICRDEIKEGMVHSHPGFVAGPGDPLTERTFPLFFEVLALLLRAGVTVVAEAAFRGPVWQPRLEPLSELAELRIVQCTLDPHLAHTRNVARAASNPVREAHTGPQARPGPDAGTFDAIVLPVPQLVVDTTDGYDPGLDAIVGFVSRDEKQDK